MLKILGVFNTPHGVTSFGSYTVWDLRQGTETSPAEWMVLENEAVRCLVLKPTNVAPIGAFVSGGSYLKWDLSINLREDVRILALTPGDDVSRTGAHGTQGYAYIATDLQCCEATQIGYPVSRETRGLPFGEQPLRKGLFDGLLSGHPGERGVGEVEVVYTPPRSHRLGYNDKKGWIHEHLTGRTEVFVQGQGYETGHSPQEIVATIRVVATNPSPVLEEALLSEEYLLTGGNVELARALAELYRKTGKVADSGLCADYPTRKAEEEAFIASGGMFDVSGYFRRMGASNNADIWVISRGGSLRDPDELVRRKDYPEGSKRWIRIEPNELVVSWSVHLLRDVYAGSTCEIVHEAVDGTAPLQLEALRRIEKEIGVKPGSFNPKHTPAVPQGTGALATTDALAALAGRFAKR